jgi:hypothetical protein
LDKAALLRLRRTRIFPQLQTRQSRLRDVSRSCNPAHMFAAQQMVHIARTSVLQTIAVPSMHRDGTRVLRR